MNNYTYPFDIESINKLSYKVGVCTIEQGII